jgi:hypothetical protein
VPLLLYGLAEGPYKFVGGFMTVWLTGWTFGVYALISRIVSLWKAPAQNGLPAAATKAGAGGMMIFAIPFVVGEIFGLTGLGDRTMLSVFSTADFHEQQTIQLAHDFRVGPQGLSIGDNLLTPGPGPRFPTRMSLHARS